MPKIHLKSLYFLLGSLFFLSGPASALYFRLDGDRLWLQAENTPLVEILDQFSRTGVDVRLDPRIQSTVTGSVRGSDLDEALDRLLESYDYLLTWKMLRGPLGRVPKLQEIQIFKPGGKTATRQRPKQSAHFDAGADHVCIQPFRPDGALGPDLRRLEALAPARQ